MKPGPNHVEYTGRMKWSRESREWARSGRFLLLLLLLAVTPISCAGRKQAFMHLLHREDYALRENEVLGLRYYISLDVVALAGPSGDEGAVVIPMDTPGTATEIGSNWIRINFGEDVSVPFVAVGKEKSEAVYWLASEIAGGEGLRRAKDSSDRVVRVGGVDYQLIRGAEAYLLIRSKDLEKLIEKRSVSGRRTR